MTQPTSVLLFAAGLGTRMAPLTNTRPKPLVEVAGRPLIEHALQFCDDLNVVVNIHAFADQMQTYLATQNVSLSDERDALFGNRGGLKRALPLLGDDPVFTMNTDAVWAGGDPVQTLLNAWDQQQMEGLLLMIPHDTAVAHTGGGDFDIAPDGRISRGTETVYSGVQIIKTDRLSQITETAFSMWSLWTPMLKAGTLFGTTFDGAWCDVGRPDCIPLAEDMLKGSADV